MNIRSALTIAMTMMAGIIFVALSMNTPASFRTSGVTRISSEPRTDLLPNLPALYVYATTTTTTTTAPPSPTPSSDVYAEWTRVAICEEGGWIGYAGPAYPDSLGISATNWVHYGGGSNLSPSAQIAVAQAIEAAAGTPSYVPDQDGCAAW